MEQKPKEKLEEFSEELITLGREIEDRLLEKRILEETLKSKEGIIRKLEAEIFTARTRRAKLSTELGKLEEKRKQFEEQKLLKEQEK